MIWLAAIIFGVSALFTLAGVRQLREKGYLFNNAWIWASASQRKAMDESPDVKSQYYRQSGTVLLTLAVGWMFIGLYVLLENSSMMIISTSCMTSAAVYAVASTSRIEKNEKRREEHDKNS